MSSQEEPRFAKPTPKVKPLPSIVEQPWSLLQDIAHSGSTVPPAPPPLWPSSANVGAIAGPAHVFPPLPPAVPEIPDNKGSLDLKHPEQTEDALRANALPSPNFLDAPEAPQALNATSGPADPAALNDSAEPTEDAASQKHLTGFSHEEHEPPDFELPFGNFDLEAEEVSILEEYEPSQTAEELEYYNSVSEGSSWEVLGGRVPAQTSVFSEGTSSGSQLIPQATNVNLVPALVSSELVSNVSFGSFKFPWEKGPLRSIFAERPAAILPAIPQSFRLMAVGPKIIEAEPTLSVQASESQGRHCAIFATVIKASKDIAFLERRADLMRACVVRIGPT